MFGPPYFISVHVMHVYVKACMKFWFFIKVILLPLIFVSIISLLIVYTGFVANS